MRRRQRSVRKIEKRWTNRSSFSESATGLIKQPGGRNNKGALGRFRDVGFGQEFPNEKQKKGKRKKKENEGKHGRKGKVREPETR